MGRPSWLHNNTLYTPAEREATVFRIWFKGSIGGSQCWDGVGSDGRLVDDEADQLTEHDA